jgi:predicted AlkP superfamily phosphohydrolase/phosphomutase
VSGPLLIVGVDGLPPALLQRLIDDGRSPHLARLARDGSCGTLRSTPNYQSASAWTSLVTGVNPGKHGVLHFTNPVGGSYDLAQIDARARRAPTIWRMLSDAGVRVAALNVPVSYPAEPVEGVMVAGWLCPSPGAEGFTHPADLAAWLRAEFGDYPIHPDVRRHATAGRYDVVAEVARAGVEVKLEAARRIFQRERPDVLCVVLTETDSLQHWCWHLLDARHPTYEERAARSWEEELLSVYVALDRGLGRLLAATGEDTDLLVVSDHGQAPNSGGQILLRPWLIHRGYLVARSSSPFRRAADAVVRRSFEGLRRRAGKRMKAGLRARFPGLQGRAQASVRGIEPDWPRTRAWTETGQIFLNTRGRWPKGCVEPGCERERLLDELREGLLGLREAQSGERAVARVALGDEQFAGAHAGLMPDLLVHWRNDLSIQALIDSDGSTILRHDAPELPTGAHHPDGTLLTSGPSFRTAESADEHSIYDVAPTLLHLLGMAVPSYLDGRVMVDLLSEDAAKEVRTAAVNIDPAASDRSSRADGEEVIRRRLRSLGYLE